MKLTTQIALLAKVDDALLLQRAPVDASLDAGQWHLPLVTSCEHAVAPHPAYCGVDMTLAAGLDSWLRAHALSPRDVLRCDELGVQNSPPWHPQMLQLQLIQVHLTRRPDTPPGQDWRWASQDEWLACWQQGELLNPFTQDLMQTQNQGQPFEWAGVHQEQAVAGLHVLPIRSHTLPPASHTNVFLFGTGSPDSPRILVDPSPADAKALEDLQARLHATPIDAILLTHHHPDHHQHATHLARQWSCPVLCSGDTRERIPARFGANYWENVEVRTLTHGDLVSQWQDVAVRAYAVPGHDAGQMALMPDNKAWMIVGDLIQGIGTVVIAKPEGDMAAYFKTLQWVIDQDPKVILPSHGQAMGSTFRIAETLRHRQMREQQILALHQNATSPQRMVEMIYAGVDKRLWGLARMNIDCHLQKLEDEGRL